MKNDLHIYVRVSTDTQKEDGFGLEDQQLLGRKVSERLGLNPIIHNEGSQSSSKDDLNNRPILTDLLNDVRNGNVENFWVYEFDRLSRNETTQFFIKKDFIENKTKLYVGDGHSYDLNDPKDSLMFNVFSSFSNYDNTLRTERLRRGRLQKLKDGDFWKGGPPPFGYKIEKKSLVKHPTESEWVKRIYEEYSEGTSLSKISDLLIQNGIRSRRGNVIFSKESILRILQNTHYEGYYLYSDKSLNETIRVGCPQIVPPKLIKSVRKRLEGRVKTSNYVKTPTLLKSFLKCDHCGSSFGQRINKSQFYNHYYCMGNQQRFKKFGKNSPKICVRSDGGRVRSLNIEDTDSIVWETIVNVLSESNLFRENKKSQTFNDQMSFGDFDKQQKNIKNQIKKREKDLEKLNRSVNQSIIETLIDDDQIEGHRSFLKSVEDKKSDLQIEIGELNDKLYNSQKTQRWVDWRKDFDDDISKLKNSDLSIEERVTFLNSTVDHIKVTTTDDKTHSINVNFTLPFVNDQLVYEDPNKKSKGYKITDGVKNLLVEIDSSDKRQKKTKDLN